MTKRMLIDATHAEETRVVVLDGSQLEDFDVETSAKRQLKGNIYLAKVVRVEPSLQAAFVEYGGNRHGFLAFGEIHPDYYQIPIADRQRLIEQEEEEARLEEEEEDRAAAEPSQPDLPEQTARATDPEPHPEPGEPEMAAPPFADAAEAPPAGWAQAIPYEVVSAPFEPAGAAQEPDPHAPPHAAQQEGSAEPVIAVLEAEPPSDVADVTVADSDDEIAHHADPIAEQPPPETVGGEGDGAEERRERRIPSRFLRNYKIQEVIRRRQILLVQVVKEERGTKGAALTTYLSLAGRFSVLMPNSPRGGGISRKITSATDRRRLKEIMAELEIPKGMGLIVRTAGANRPKPEIRRDCEYLLRLWDDIREHTLRSVAPALIYEEASLIKRAIRDVYSRDIDEILVDGEQGWRAAHEFMRMLMPSHAKKVQLWKNGGMPLFAKNQVEAQLDGMLMPTVQLRSGGYLVINQTEALVAIDVNSGRSTRERGIEETALRTNLEAADEAARQLRLRDLAGLIVIDFIDMESRKHNAMVEKRLKDALKNDRARIQVGHISHFGLMEMSRQRLRPSLAETSFIACPHCGGLGHVRSTESAAIHVLRGIEEEGGKRRAAEIVVYAAPPVALYILNHKRERLAEIEQRYAMRVLCLGDDGQMTSQFRIDRVRAQTLAEAPVAITQDVAQPAGIEAEEEAPDVAVDEDEVADDAIEAEAVGAVVADTEADDDDAPVGETAEEAEHRHRRRRRRRRGGRREDAAAAGPADEARADEARADAAPANLTPAEEAGPHEVPPTIASETRAEPAPAAGGDDETRDAQAAGGRPRRGRRGGRRRRPEGNGEMPPHAEPGADQPELPPVYIGPTPANPFGGHTFDIFDVMEQAEAAATVVPRARAASSRSATRSPALPVASEEPNSAVDSDLAGRTEPSRFESAPQALAPEPAPAETMAHPGEGARLDLMQEPQPIAIEVPMHEPVAVAPAEADGPTEQAEATTAEPVGREATAPAESASVELLHAAAAPVAATAPTAPEPVPAEVSQAATAPAESLAASEPAPAEAAHAVAEPVEAIAPAEPAPAEATHAAVEPVEAMASAEPAAEAPDTASEPVQAMPPAEPATQAAPETPPPQTDLPPAANDMAPQPAIQPIVIGSDQTVVVEKKRGWWRR